MQYIYDIKFGMLQVCDNDISLRKWSGGTALLRTLEGKLVITPPWSLVDLWVVAIWTRLKNLSWGNLVAWPNHRS